MWWVCRILLASVRPLPTRLGARSLRSRAPTRVVCSGLRCLAEASGRACDSAARPDGHQQARHEPTTRWIQAKSIRLGAFDGDPGIRPSYRIFVDYAAPWEPIPEDGLERFREGGG